MSNGKGKPAEQRPLTFNLRPEDRRLIDAAIILGDWLVAHPAITSEQLRAVRALQAALRRMPEDSPDILDAEYGFTIAPPDLARGVAQSWTVSLCRHAPGDPGVLELFNTYSTLPEGNPLEDAVHESCFYLDAGSRNPYTADWRELIEEFTDPPEVQAGATFEIEAEHVRSEDGRSVKRS